MPSLLINQGTNSAVMFEDQGGTAFRQSIAVDHGTITLSDAGTIIQNAGGTIDLLKAGTITTLPNIPGGTLALVTRAGNIGTLESGTITSIANLVGGTITRLVDGTIRIPAGTITSVTDLANLAKGTVTEVGQINNGSIRMTVGTMSAGTVNTGTVNAGTINTGTVNAGTINAGTFVAQPYPAAQVLSAGTTSAGTIGTLIAAPAASNGIYINSLIVNAISGTPEVVLSYALQAAGPQVVNRGAYVAGGGVALSFPHPSYYGTAAAALTFNMLSGSGTVSYAVTYTTKGTP